MPDYSHLGFDSRLRKVGGFADRRVKFVSALKQDEMYERTPYGNPTAIHKGQLTITGGGTLTIKDATGGTSVFSIDPTTGSLTQVGNIGITGNAKVTGTMYAGGGSFTSDLNVGGTVITGAYAKGDTAYAVHPGPRQWTTNNSWTNLNSTDFRINGDSFALTNVFFEVLGAVEVDGRTASFRVYNVTDAAAVADGTIDITGTAAEANGWADAEFGRTDALTFASGQKQYKLQIMQDVVGTAGDSAQFFKGVIFYENT